MRQGPSRRQFIQGLGIGGLALLCDATASIGLARQTPVPRLGVLSLSAAMTPLLETLRGGLRELGYIEGQNLLMDWRFGGGVTQLGGLAEELVRLHVDLIFADSGPAIVAAMGATRTIPLVFVTAGDPVELGLAASLEQPGGNVSGVTLSLPAYGDWRKRLELLQATVPALAGVRVLRNPTSVDNLSIYAELDRIAPTLGLVVQPMDASSVAEVDAALDAASPGVAQAFMSLPGPVFAGARRGILNRVAQHRWPAIYDSMELVADGGLMAWGASRARAFHRAAAYVDALLQGASPAEMPIEGPATFDFAINLRTAQALGLTIPQEIMLQVTEVID